jgi:hypothetical protein
MELQLSEELEIDFGPDCKFELPSYITRLAPEDVDKEEGCPIVIACGSDPQDGKITLITMSGRVMIFDARKFYIPDGPAEPSFRGRKVFLKNVDGRWPGETPGFHVDAKWILEKSTSGLTGAVLQTNYIHENNSP